MELIKINDVNKKYNLGELVATLGMFDGVHMGHQLILKELLKVSKEKKLKSAVITFLEHPDYVLKKRDNNGYLTNQELKLKIFEELEIDYVIIFNFDDSFLKLSHFDFENILVKKLNIKTMIQGKDTKYGYNGLGSIETLKETLDVIVVEDYLYDNLPIHSKRIRDLLIQGEIEIANKMLGRDFSISGNVSFGNQIGQQFGMRTANIELKGNYQYLRNGVYGSKVSVDEKEFLAITNIGNNPSFNFVLEKRLETHILDFDENIYGKTIVVKLLFFIRDEKFFSSKEELFAQINKDIVKFKKKIEEN